MSAIFKKIHDEEAGSELVLEYMNEHLSKKPALLSKSEGNEAVYKEFFLQHVSLELFRYFGTEDKLHLIDPFLSADDYHVQISAVRAIGQINAVESKKRLIEFVESDRVGFAKVMAIWALDGLNAREHEERLKVFVRNGTDEQTGFGGDIMDPRVGTRFPESVKSAVTDLLDKWND